MPKREVIEGDCRNVIQTLPEQSIQCCVTSPPYLGQRDYGVEGQIGLKEPLDKYIAELVNVFRSVRRVLRDDGTAWLNIGDAYAHNGGIKQGHRDTFGCFGGSDGQQCTQTYGVASGGFARAKTIGNGIKPKDLLGLPWMVAFALRADGWYLRSATVWHKPNVIPESCKDRPTSAYEMVFLLTKQPVYFYDADAISEAWADERKGASGARLLAYSEGSGRHDTLASDGKRGLGAAPATEGRNARNVWSINTKPFYGPHFATMPVELAKRCIKAGSRPGDTVLDPFGGAGTTAVAAEKLGRNSVSIELNPDNIQTIKERLGLVIPKDFFKQP